MRFGSVVACVVERVLVPVEGMHRAIAKPWITATGVITDVDPAYDLMLRSVYGSIRVGTSVLGAGLNAHVKAEWSSADTAVAVINGLWGDDLGRHQERLEIPMTLLDRHRAALTFGTTPESASIAGNMSVAPTDQKKKLRFLLDPSGSGTTVELLLQLDDQGQDNPWSIKSCTIEAK